MYRYMYAHTVWDKIRFTVVHMENNTVYLQE